MEPGYYNGKIVTYKPDLLAVKWLVNWLEARKNMPLVKESTKKVIPFSLEHIINTELDRMAATPIIKYDPTIYGKNGASGYYKDSRDYSRKEYGIAYNGNVSDSVRLHERTHSLKPTPLADLIESFDPKKHQRIEITNITNRLTNKWIADNSDLSAISKVYGGIDNYYNDPNEIYARLMLLRQANNIDPRKVWTVDEIKQLRKSKTLKDFNIFDRYDDDFILKLFNEVADIGNQNTSIDIPLYARRGTKLIPRKFRFK